MIIFVNFLDQLNKILVITYAAVTCEASNLGSLIVHPYTTANVAGDHAHDSKFLKLA